MAGKLNGAAATGTGSPVPVPALAPTQTPSTLRSLALWFGIGASPAPPAAPPAAPLPAVPQSTGPWRLVSSTALSLPFVGVTQNHPLALTAVVGVSNNSMRGYKTQALALDAFNIALTAGLVEIRPY
ncbi:hypothetical protein B0H14DRAFT_3487807 [Mycena olivaceomarginata]|nr:hypothetical protein B0H14DRAFT_3487807 [Mycena olivaceomarginata]